MPVVTTIELPPPRPFVESEDGAEALGAAYRFVAPRMATEPLVFQAADGATLLWTPTELVYGDVGGQLDYIAGSAPTSFTVRGRSVHYPRTFPASEEVHVALPDGRKYWLYLYEPPRTPAPYLSGDMWFGVSGMVGGVPLPPGRHVAFESVGFRFQPVYAEDTMGARVEGWYEVIDTDLGQQLFICIPADWLLDPDRVYPVKVDPTVIVTDSSNYSLLRLSDALLVVGAFRVFFSFDEGISWTSGSITGSPPSSTDVVADSNNRIWSTMAVSGDSGNYWELRVYSVSGTTLTLTATAPIYPDLSSVTSRGVLALAVKGNDCYVLYRCRNASRHRISSVKATLSGTTLTVDTNHYTKDEVVTSGDATASGGVAITSSGVVTFCVSYAAPHNRTTICQHTQGRGSGGIAATFIWDPIGVSGLSESWWLDYDQKRLVSQSGQTVPIPGIQSPRAATYIQPQNAIAVVGADADGKLAMQWYYLDSGIWSDVTTRDISPRITSAINNADIQVPQMLISGNVPTVFRDAAATSNLMFEMLTLNAAPQTPSNLERPPFDATDDALFKWQHNDPDSGDSQSAYHLQIRLAGADTDLVDTGEVQSPFSQHVLPGGTLQNGQTYQWRVRTADQAGEWSPWSDYAVFQTGPKPQATILHPTAGATVSTSEVTVQWSVPSQSRATVRLYDGAGQTVLQQHEVTTPSARAKTITGLENGQSYQVSVQPVSSIGVVGDEVFSGPFSVQYTPPPKPSITATGADGRIRITIINPPPAEGEPEVTHNDLYRREPGGAWVRIATGIEPDGTYDDYAVGSGVIYEYRARAVGANGTYTDSDPVSAIVTFDEWRFSPVDGQPEIRFRFDSSVTWRPEEDVQVPRTMSRYQRTYRNPSYPRVATIQARFRDGEDGLTVREQRERLLRYIEQGVVGWLRGPHGDCWRGVLLEPEVLPSTHFARETVTCVFRETREAP